ncbi:hypothetical protein LTS08_006971 [Lithohypha guttulata]|uniref:Uncharacterized protein n=1 Tax=Lithohypha guttulata TaxID=1690604 RepID=A0AAN7T5U4_9EURO|nr:hypothetical protein LTR51_002021 [Lithohypha guttulata]KAK5090247.1 hypothetical protein LTR05_000418 [Lithohypha guttulata]KAK5097557.1 hypothetical protein LTS08_006971 [Lithohypha guttulata]
MNTPAREYPAWQKHKNTDSLDSETSFFDLSTSSTTDGSWSGYFDGWTDQAQDNYCPEIVSASNSPTRSAESDKTPLFDPEGLLPNACPRSSRPASVRSGANVAASTQPSRRSMKARRRGIVPHADLALGDDAITRLDSLLNNSMSNTEDILAAMYSADWDAASLQKWYEQSTQSPADLALFKIMFSLRYTFDDPSPLPT